MKTFLKTLTVLLAILAITAGFTACPPTPLPEPKPPTNISVKNSGGAEVTQITIDVGEEVELTVSATDATSYNWQITSGGGTIIQNNGSGAVAKIKGLAKGTTSITAIASNNDGFIDKVINVTVNDVDTSGLLVLGNVTSGSTGTWAADTLTINDKTADFSLSVSGTVDSETVTLTNINWEITGTTGIVTVNTSGLVSVLKSGSTQVKVTAGTAGKEPASKTITIVVLIDYNNVLYVWSNAAPPLGTGPSFGTGAAALTSSGHMWPHPNVSSFMAQKGGMKVTNIRSYGGGIADNGGIRVINNSRLVIGQSAAYTTTDTDSYVTNVHGEIDLYRKQVKLTINYKDLANPGDDRRALRVFVNQNTTGMNNSMFGESGAVQAPSILAEFFYNEILAMPGNTAAQGTVVINIDTTKSGDHAGGKLFEHANEAGLAKAFICLFSMENRTGSPVPFGITFTGIRLDYISGEPAPDPLTLNVQSGSTDIPPAGITIVSPETVTLNAIANPADAAISWVSNGTGIATVSSATGSSVTVTPVSEGKTTITVTASKAGYLTVTRTISVTVQVNPVGLTVKQGENPVAASIPMKVGATAITLTADTVPVDADISWVSNNVAVTFNTGTSSATGGSVTINAAAVGTAKITVTASKTGYKDTIKEFNVVVSPATGGIDIIIDVFNDFDGFSDITLALDDTADISLLSTDIDSASWYIEGELAGTGTDWTLDPAELGLGRGEYSLAVAVKVNGTNYSRTVKLTVTE